MDFTLNLESLSSAGDHLLPVKPGVLYDVCIVGGGPAGLTAAVYAMRKGLVTALVTDNFGGQVKETSSVENYMGYRYIEGAALADRFREQVKQFDIAIAEHDPVMEIFPGINHRVKLASGIIVDAKSLLFATGKSWRHLNVPGEKELTGRGVAYCTICDAPLFKGKDVAVVGGGNSGAESAIDLARVASHVTIFQNLDALTADKTLCDQMAQFPNISVITGSAVTDIRGSSTVESIAYKDIRSGDMRTLSVAGVFISIGLVPDTAYAKGIIPMNGYGEIIINGRCETGVAGIFAAGDCTDVPFKQIIIAAGEGAKAALSACEYVRTGK